MNRSVLIFLFIVSFYSLPAFAVTFINNSSTEASYGCSEGRCTAAAPKSNILRMCEEMKVRAAWADDWQCMNTAIFNNGTTPDRLANLRNKPASSLTNEEKAILIAADKVGTIGPCNGVGGNAFLIMYQGRPAVVTTAHTLLDAKTGKMNCTEDELKQAIYFPNTSYYDPENPNQNQDFYLKSVGLEYPPVNLKEARAAFAASNHINVDQDYAIFFLKDDITKDKMPQGHQRSYFKYSQNTQSRGQGLYSLGMGYDPSATNSLAVMYQNQCNYNRTNKRINHDCASINGSSGSVLGLLEDGEIKFSGINRYAFIGNTNMSGPTMNYENLWNTGTTSQYIKDQQ